MVLSESDFTINSPSEFRRSVKFAVPIYSIFKEIGLVKLNLYSKEFPIPIGTSLTKSPLFFGTTAAELVVGTLLILLEKVLE